VRKDILRLTSTLVDKVEWVNDTNDNPLIFWNEQESLLSNISKLAERIFCNPASSTAVERAFSSAGAIVSQRRINLNPSTVNDIILVRSVARHGNSQL
jgi:hypothetical protein